MKASITEEQILELLGEVRWDRIAADLSMPLEYGEYASETLLKIHLLPYLLPIRSERQLAFAVAEKDTLRRGVGLIGINSPPRGTLWHFRKRNLQLFRRLLVRGLSVIYLAAEARKIIVPFLGEDHCSDKLTGPEDRFCDKISGTCIEIVYPLASRLISRAEQLVLPLDVQSSSFIGVAPRLFLPYEIGFPLQVTFVQSRDLSLAMRVVFIQPSWLNDPYGRFEIGDYISRTKTPYTACNVIVKRNVDGRDQILLSKRLQGSGQGRYTLPGGKKHQDESVRACARRELEEETGLVLVKARPVSVRDTNYSGYPRVRSIGVLVEEAQGKPRRREHLQHSNWEWYDLADLPSPLFFPAEIALSDFRSNQFPDLTWRDVEDPVDLPLWRKE